MHLAAVTADDELLVVARHLKHAHRGCTKLKHRLDDRELVGRKLELRTIIPRASQQAGNDALAKC